MAITSGVRAVTGTITIGGTTVAYERASVEQKAARENSTFSVICALNSFPGGEAFFGSLSDNSASVNVNDTVLLTGEADAVEINYLHSSVHISGQDKGEALQNSKSNESFKNKTREDIIQTIAQKFGMSANIQTAGLLAGKKTTQDYVKLTDGISYGAVLHKLAELGNARWSISGTTLNFLDGASTGGEYQIIYQPGQPARSNFIDLKIDINYQIATNSITVNTKGWNTKTKQVVESTKTSSPASGGGSTPAAGFGGGSGIAAGGGGGLTYSYRADQIEKDHADDLTTNKMGETLSQELTVHCTLVGDASLDPTMKIRLQGTSFDQSYDIIEIHHEIDFQEGWIMEVKATAKREGRSVG